MAVYLGETDEEKINNMSIPFFNDVLKFLGKKVNYDAVVNYAGNSFAKDSWKMIQEANPLIKESKLGSKFIELIDKGAKRATQQDLDDMAWINEVASNEIDSNNTEQKEDGTNEQSNQ